MRPLIEYVTQKIYMFHLTFIYLVKIAVTSVNCAVDDCVECGSSILINGREYSKKRDGINMVVFDTNSLSVTSTHAFGVSEATQMMSAIKQLSGTSLVIISTQVLCDSGSSIDTRTQSFVMDMVQRLMGRTLRGMHPFQLR